MSPAERFAWATILALQDKALAEMRKGVAHYIENARHHAEALADGAAEG